MLIYFCDTCKSRISAAEMEAQTAVFVEENKALCAKCAAARKSSKSSRAVIRAAGRTAESGKTPTAGTSLIKGAAGGAAAEASAPAQESLWARVLSPDLRVAIVVGCAGLALFVIGLFVALRGAGSEDSAGGAGPGASAGPLTNITPARQPGKAPGKSGPAARGSKRPESPQPPPEQAVKAPAPPAEKSPLAVAPEPPAEPAKITPIVIPTAPGETVWIEDALPPGATADGTLAAASWKWVAQPEPVYSGTHSHTMGAGDGQPKPQGLQRHSFHGANPPLQAGPADLLFTYVYLDPNDPPKEIMLEWQFRGSWEHRAYWGQDEIQLGNNFSPSRMQAGSLPKGGAWVPLEVRASEIGVEAAQEAITGWSFAQFGGLAYWDRAGVRAAPKPEAVAIVNPPAPQVPQPSPPPTPVAAPAPPAPAPPQPGAPAKLLWKDFEGGEDKEKAFAGQEARAVYAKPTKKNALRAAFELAPRPNGFGAADVVATTFLRGRQPCLLALSINGKEIFNGRDAATKKEQWSEQRYAVPAGLLRAGKNEIRIENLEPAGELNKEPFYLLRSLEVVFAPDFPPLVSEPQRALIQICERVEQVLKKELDTSAKIAQALPLAKGATAPEAASLAGMLEKAQSLYQRAVANLAKTPPAGDVRIEKLKQTVRIVGMAGGKVSIKAAGMQMDVDLAWLPQSVLVKALACDESKAYGLAEKAVFCFVLGDDEPAQTLLKRFKKEELPPWAVFFDQRAALARLVKFESAVNNVEALLRSAKAADALPALEALKKDYPGLLEANKERLSYLAAEAAKK